MEPAKKFDLEDFINTMNKTAEKLGDKDIIEYNKIFTGILKTVFEVQDKLGLVERNGDEPAPEPPTESHQHEACTCAPKSDDGAQGDVGAPTDTIGAFAKQMSELASGITELNKHQALIAELLAELVKKGD
jgi:hypothetical protein